MTHEIVNLQFGNYSNYVGSHFWNIQESQFVYEYNHNPTKSIPDVNHDVLFREGLNIHNQITYTPRLILFDFKENIGKVNLFNQFIETQQQQSKQRTKPTWNGQIEVFKQDKREVSKLDLENHQIEELAKEVAANSSQILAASSKTRQSDDDTKIEFWSDYSKIKYHDRSYMLLNASQATKTNTGSTDEEIFDLYTHGIDAFKSPLFAEEFEDSFRHFVEECDLVQGFQMSIDAFNGFGGLATQSLGFINDEFPKSSIMTFMLFPHQHNHSKESSNIKLINTMLTLRGLLEEKNDLTVVPLSLFSSFYSEKDRLKPIDLYSVKYNPSVDYHTSAILASLIDSTTLPWRQKSQRTNMSDLFEQVDMYKYKIGSLQALYPFWLEKPNNYLFDYLRESDLLKDATHFSPMCGKSVDNDDDDDDVSGFLNVVCRGIENNQSKNEKDNYYFNGIVPAHSVLDKYLVDMYPKSKSKSYSIEARLNTNSPYPKMIDEKINRKNQIALLTALQFNKKIFNWLDYMNRSIELMKIQKEMLYYSSSFEEDDFVNLKVFNQDLCDIYSS